MDGITTIQWGIGRLGGLTMNEQKYLNVEMKVKFDVPVYEDFDIEELSEEELEDIANDYFFECGGIYTADYLDYEFDI